jgi:hypothetical protein
VCVEETFAIVSGYRERPEFTAWNTFFGEV